MIKLSPDNTGAIVVAIIELVPEFKEYKDFEPEYIVEKEMNLRPASWSVSEEKTFSILSGR